MVNHMIGCCNRLIKAVELEETLDFVTPGVGIVWIKRQRPLVASGQLLLIAVERFQRPPLVLQT